MKLSQRMSQNDMEIMGKKRVNAWNAHVPKFQTLPQLHECWFPVRCTIQQETRPIPHDKRVFRSFCPEETFWESLEGRVLQLFCSKLQQNNLQPSRPHSNQRLQLLRCTLRVFDKGNFFFRGFAPTCS